MDGNEQNLSAVREGIGVTPSQLETSTSPVNPNAYHKRALDLSNISSVGRSAVSSTAAGKTVKAIKATKKKVTDQIRSASIVKRSTSNGGRGAGLRLVSNGGRGAGLNKSSLSAMMHRMNEGKAPDAEGGADAESQLYDGWEEDILEDSTEESDSLLTDEHGNADIEQNSQDSTFLELMEQDQDITAGHDKMDIDGKTQNANSTTSLTVQRPLRNTEFVKASALAISASNAQTTTTTVTNNRNLNGTTGTNTTTTNGNLNGTTGTITTMTNKDLKGTTGANTTTTNRNLNGTTRTITTTINRNLNETTGTNTTTTNRNLNGTTGTTTTTTTAILLTNTQVSHNPRGNSSILQVAPAKQAEEPRREFFTYTFQLTFQQPITDLTTASSKKTFNVPENFRKFFKQLRIAAPDVLLQPYNESGTPITNEDQLPEEDIETYNTYYHNHSITPAGHLTGMCVIMLPCTWWQLKNNRTTFFKWLQDKKVFMKYTSFKADQLSAAGWFFDLHPDVIRKEEVVQELCQRLKGILPQDVLFQLAPRYLRVSEHQGSKQSFNFKAVAVECDRKHVKTLQEAFYQLGNPKVEKYNWPITGRALFIPFLATDAWQHHKILGMAKVQEKEMDRLGQVFLTGLQKIDVQLRCQDGKKATIRELLLRLHEKEAINSIHSVHNTNREGVISILYNKEHTLSVECTLRKIQEVLESSIHPDDHVLISPPGTKVELIGRQNRVDSSQAKVYATFADEYLENPQGGEEEEDVEVILPPLKRQANKRLPPKLSYSAVVTKAAKKTHLSTAKGIDESVKTTANKRVTAHKLYEGDTSDEAYYSVDEDSKAATLEERFQDRFDQMEKHFEERYGKMEGISTEEVEMRIQESTARIQEQSEKYLDRRLQEFTLEITEKISEGNAKMKEAFKLEMETAMEAAYERMFHRFKVMLEKQNTVVSQQAEKYEQQFEQIYQALGQGEHLQYNSQVATAPRGMGSGEGK